MSETKSPLPFHEGPTYVVEGKYIDRAWQASAAKRGTNEELFKQGPKAHPWGSHAHTVEVTISGEGEDAVTEMRIYPSKAVADAHLAVPA